MRKLMITACAVLGMNIASAQYFQHTYGNGSTAAGHSGITVSSGGYMMVGETPGSFGTDLTVTWADANGSPVSGAPYMNKAFEVTNPTNNSRMPAVATDVTELSGNFYIAGRVADPTSLANKVYPFVMILDNSGSFISMTMYDAISTTITSKVSIEQAHDGTGDIFIACTGKLYQPATEYGYTARLNGGGTIIWSITYNVLSSTFKPLQTFANDLVENNYTLYVAGSVLGSSVPYETAYITALDATTGAAATVPIVEYDLGKAAIFSGISYAPNVNALVAAGRYDDDALTVLIEPVNMNLIWATHHDNTQAPGKTNEAFSARERVNTSGISEFYSIGELRDPATGVTYLQLLKLDYLGNIIGNGEFMIWGNKYAAGRELDFESSGQGLVAFGTSDVNGPVDMLIARTYFNGEGPCNTIQYSLADQSPLHTLYYPPVSNTGVSSQVSLTVVDYTLNEKQYCFSQTLPNGDNARIANPGKGSVQAGAGGFVLKQAGTQLELIPATEGPAIRHTYHITLYDLSGKALLAFTQEAPAGQSSTIALGNYGLSSGYYLVSVESAGTVHHKKIFIAP